MSTPLINGRARRMARGLFLCAIPALSSLFLAACGKSNPAGGAGSTSATPASSAAPGASGAAAAPGSAAPAAGGAAPAAVGKGIQVSIKDLQLFHPYSAKRTLQPVREDTNFSTR